MRDHHEMFEADYSHWADDVRGRLAETRRARQLRRLVLLISAACMVIMITMGLWGR